MICLSLGSNLGDRARNLATGISLLARNGFEVGMVSSLYETPPWGKTDQPAFLNIAVEGEWKEGPHALLDTIQKVEKEAGRIRQEKWGPRVLDIDIIEFDGRVVLMEDLRIPHKEAIHRLFVLIPLAEINPELILTDSEVSVETLIAGFPEAEIKGIRKMHWPPGLISG